MLQGVYSEMAQNSAGQGTESGAAGVSGRCNYDVDSEGTGEGGKEVMKLKNVLIVLMIWKNPFVFIKRCLDCR